MSVKKSLSLGLTIGLLAMAFGVLPGVASAAEQPVLTSPAGTKVAVGATITATSTNAKTVFAPSIGTLECEKVVVNGIVKKNSTTEGVEVLMDEEAGAKDSATGCKLAGVAVEVKPTFESLILTNASKTAKFTFTTSTGLSEKSESTVTYSPPATSIKVKGSVTGTQVGNFEGDFTAVVKSTGKSVVFD